MTGLDWIQIALFLGLLIVCTPLTRQIHGTGIQNDSIAPLLKLRPIENGLYRLIGVNSTAEQDWKTYALALIAFNGIGFIFLFVLQLVQGWLPLNPAGLGNVEPFLAFNTATSFNEPCPQRKTSLSACGSVEMHYIGR